MAARSYSSYAWLLWGLALTGLALDLGSKYAVFAWLTPDGPGGYGRHELVPGAFDLLTQYTATREPAGASWRTPLRTAGGEYLPQVNHGALFGFGGDYKIRANGVFAAISVAAALTIAFWGTRPSTRRDGFLCAALGLILAGTLGNLYDRVVFDGVRDFLHWHYAFDWPVFNIADCCLVGGAALLLLQAFWAPVEAPTADAAQVTALRRDVETVA